jgi:hypothetical protein
MIAYVICRYFAFEWINIKFIRIKINFFELLFSADETCVSSSSSLKLLLKSH